MEKLRILRSRNIFAKELMTDLPLSTSKLITFSAKRTAPARKMAADRVDREGKGGLGGE
jgi:hypothetical protein